MNFLSATYSNLYNHPKKIVEPSKKDKPIQLTKRIGIPDDVLPQRGLTLKQLEKEERAQRQFNTAPTVRPKGETAEDKRARKQAVREQRRVRMMPIEHQLRHLPFVTLQSLSVELCSPNYINCSYYRHHGCASLISF